MKEGILIIAKNLSQRECLSFDQDEIFMICKPAREIYETVRFMWEDSTNYDKIINNAIHNKWDIVYENING